MSFFIHFRNAAVHRMERLADPFNLDAWLVFGMRAHRAPQAADITAIITAVAGLAGPQECAPAHAPDCRFPQGSPHTATGRS